MNAVMFLVSLPVIAALALLVISFVRFPYNPERLGRMPQAWQLPQSALLIVFAMLTLAVNRVSRIDLILVFILLGIAAGFCGDLFMANVFHQRDYVRNGMVAFAVGHVFYLLAFGSFVSIASLNNLAYYALAMVVLYAIAVILWYRLVRAPQRSPLEYAALVYALFLATMAALAWGIELHLLLYPRGGDGK